MGRHGGMQHGPRRTVKAAIVTGHGDGHGHGPAAPASPATRVVLGVLLGPMLLVAVIGAFLLWPNDDDMPEQLPFVSDGASVVSATATGEPDGSTMLVDAELGDGTAIEVVVQPEAVGVIEAGDPLRLLYVAEAEGYGSPYVFIDFERDVPLWILAIVFVLAVVGVARWRGLAAIVGLGAAFAMIIGFTLPALLAGEAGLPVALVTATLVMFVVLYVAHGFTARTTTALLGTLVGLLLTALIAWIATDAARMTGTGTEEALMLYTRAGLDLRDVFMAGVILAGMGVLNDVTITQASAVWELRAVAPRATRGELFSRAMRIGRDHIASTVYTIAFAYVGAALPVLMIMMMTDAPGEIRLTTGQVAEEVVRTLVGSIGLVLAIPVTTAIAALVVSGPAAGEQDAESGIDELLTEPSE